jgi:hypothetical protein
VSGEWPGAEPPSATPDDAAHAADERGQASVDGGLVRLLDASLLVPIRSSTGANPDPARLSLESMRHGTDDQGRFLAAFTGEEEYEVLGPPASDRVELTGRQLFERAEGADERVIVNPGSPDQIEVAAGVLPFLLAGIDLATPEAMRARRRLGALPDLEAPTSLPEPFATEMRGALTELPAVERAWLLRVGTAWTVGVQLDPDAPLAEFDSVRNRLHALAAEHLGSRRDVVVTDLRGAALRSHYESIAAPYYERAAPRGFLSRLLGIDG